MKIKYWIMKSEPTAYSISDLKKDKETLWDGIRNYQVRNMFRDDMNSGDKALFYHSSTEPVGIVGEMKVLKSGEPDPTQFDKIDSQYDPKSKKDDPTWLAPTVGFVKQFDEIITLKYLKSEPKFADLPIVKKGNRLSVVEISKDQFEEILKLTK